MQHDAAARAAKSRENRLQHGDLTDDVHLELTSELVERDELERRRDRDPGVVDEPVELRADDLGRRGDLRARP